MLAHIRLTAGTARAVALSLGLFAVASPATAQDESEIDPSASQPMAAPESTPVESGDEYATPALDALFSEASNEEQDDIPETQSDTALLDTIPVESIKPEAPAAASDTGPSSLENVVVVAQKRAQLMQDVPISLSVVDKAFIERWSLTDLNTATLYTPNVKITDAGYFIMPRIRGFGTDQNNKAFEPPAGVAVDGIPYTRLEYFSSAMFDVSRMEVYRGPQGTAFGKNTTAGLIHLITNSPTDAPQGFVDVQYGDFDRRRVEAAVGGPLVDDFLNFRVAGLSDERTGYVHNSTTDEVLDGAPRDGHGSKRQGVRAKLHFVDLFGSSLLLTGETVHIEAIGAGIEMYDVTPAMQAAIRRYEPQTDFIRANYVNSINDPDFRDIRIDSVNAEWRAHVGEWGLVGVGGYSVLRNEAALDIDMTPAPAIFGSDADRSPTTTAELRFESPELDGLLGLNNLFGADLGFSNLIGGVYYQKRDIQGDGILFRFGLSYLDLFLVSEGSNSNGGVPGPVGGLLSALLPLLPPIFEDTNGSYTEEVTQDFDQQAEAQAVFTQLQWQFASSWAIEYGIRFNRETKDAQFNQYYSSPNPPILLPILQVNEYEAQLSRDEDNIAQRVSLNYLPAANFNVFFHWARGFRGGGYNAFSYDGSPETLQYEPETATDWGIDFKSTLLDGRMRLNLSLFRLDVDDFQVLVGQANDLGVGLGTTQVKNAAKARAQGVEGDMTWLMSDWFTLFATLGYNDSEYLDFTDNACAPDNEDTDGNGDGFCDATGKPFALTPDITGTMLGVVTLPLSGNGLGIQIGGGIDYQSSQYTNTNLDERFKQEAVTRWRAMIGIGNPRRGWAFRLQGENLTDETATIRQAQMFKGQSVEGLDAPRTIYGSFRYNF